MVGMNNIKLDVMALERVNFSIHGSVKIEKIEIPLNDGNVVNIYSHTSRTAYGIMDDIEDLYLVIDDSKLAWSIIENIDSKTHTQLITKSEDKLFIRHNDLKTNKVTLGKRYTFRLERFFVGSAKFEVSNLDYLEKAIETEILKNKTISLLNTYKYKSVKSFSMETQTDNFLDIHLYMYTSLNYSAVYNVSLFGVAKNSRGNSFPSISFIEGKEDEINHLYKLVFKNDDYKSDADFFINIFRGVEYLLSKNKNKSIKDNKFLEILELNENFKRDINFNLDSYFKNENIEFWDYIFSSMCVSFRNYYSHTEENKKIYLEEPWLENLTELFLSLFQYYLYYNWGLIDEYLRYTNKPQNPFTLENLVEIFIKYKEKNKLADEDAMKATTYLNLSPMCRSKLKLNNKNYLQKILVENKSNMFNIYSLKDSKKININSFNI